MNRILAKLRGQDVTAILIRGAGSSFLIKVFGTGIAFATQIFLARVMGAKDYGIYVYVLTWLSILLLLAKMGWDTLLLKYVAAYKAREEWGALRGVLRSSNQLALVASIVVSLITALVVWTLRNQLNSDLTYTFWIGCIILPVLTLTQLRQATLRALKYVALAQLPDMILRPTLLGVLVGVVFFGLAQSVNSVTAMLLNFTAATTSFLVGAYWLNRLLPKPVKLSTADYRRREWIKVALPLFLISSMSLVLNQTDTIMCGAILGTTKAGIYAVVCRLITLILFGLNAVNTIAAPMISELYTSGKHSELQKMVTNSARGIFAYSLPVGLVMILFGNSLLSLFGSTFSEGYLALVILTMGQLVNALAGSVGFLMSMTGHQKEALYVISSSAILNVILNAILIPIFGINGAAIATAITTALWNITMFIFVQTKLKINPTIFSIRK